MSEHELTAVDNPEDQMSPELAENQEPIAGSDSAVVSSDPSNEEGAPVVQPRLVVKRAGVETDEVFPFMCPATIGRFDPTVGPIDIDLGKIEEGTYVSRKHAKIVEENGEFKIVDLGSSNGTYVTRDGEFQKVDEAPIQSGDEIALGNARLVFYV